MAAAPRDEALDRVRAHGQMLVDRGMTRIRISMLQSIERGRHIEVEAMFGVLARAAARARISAPVTTTTYRLLAGLDRHLT
jgi:ketopantoate reductase